MKDCCPGPPPAAAGTGGMRQQLNSLRSGLHPVTGLRLPESSGSTALGSGTYSRLKPTAEADPDFVPYAPTLFDPPTPSGLSAEMKRRLMRGRVLCKISSKAARLRRQRRKQVKLEVLEIIRSFCDDADDGGQQEMEGQTSSSGDHGQQAPVEADVCSDEEFWANLPAMSSRERHVQCIPTEPIRKFPGKAIKLRLNAFDANGTAP